MVERSRQAEARDKPTMYFGKRKGGRCAPPALTDPSVARFATLAALLAAQPTQRSTISKGHIR